MSRRCDLLPGGAGGARLSNPAGTGDVSRKSVTVAKLRAVVMDNWTQCVARNVLIVVLGQVCIQSICQMAGARVLQDRGADCRSAKRPRAVERLP